MFRQVVLIALASGALGLVADGEDAPGYPFTPPAPNKKLNASRIAVICDHDGKHKKFGVPWMAPFAVAHKVVFIGGGTSITWRDARPSLQWIVDHYESLPDYVIFLHGEQKSYHSNIVMSHLMASTPSNCDLLSKCVWPSLNVAGFRGDLAGHARWALDAYYESLWGMNFETAWNKWKMDKRYRCCSELIVSKGAILHHHKRIYIALMRMMDRHPDFPWSWAMERTWENLFTRNTYPHEEVSKQLMRHTKAGYQPFNRPANLAKNISESWENPGGVICNDKWGPQSRFR